MRVAAVTLVALVAGCSQKLEVFDLERPLQLSVRSLENGNFLVAWSPVPGADSYRIYLAPDDGVTSENWDLLGGSVETAPDPEQTVSGTEAGAVYSLVVTAVAGESESADSPRVHAKKQSVAPLPAAPDQLLTIPDQEARFGTALATGDVNCDGRDDLLIGAPELPGVGGGEAALHFGRAAGVSAQNDDSYISSNGFGSSVAAGDVTGDGCAEMLVGGPLDSGSTGEASLYSGGPSSIGDQIWFAVGNNANEFLGESVAMLGDVDGDGLGDFAVSARGASTGQEIEVYSGDVSAPSTSVLSYIPLATGGPDPIVIVPVGYVTPDGRADVFTGAPSFDFPALSNHGRAGIQSYPVNAFTIVWDEEGTDAEQLFGSSAAAADVNGDGWTDLVVGSPGVASGLGALDVYLRNGDTGLIQDVAASRIASTDSAGKLGTTLVAAGDIDGNGLDDVFASAPGAQSERGRVDLFSGGAGGSLTSIWSAVGTETDAGFGRAIANGDFNGDGVRDLAVGSPGWTSSTYGPDVGEVAIFLARVGLAPLADAGEVLRGAAGEPLTPQGAWFQDRARRRHWRCTWNAGDGSAPVAIDPCTPETAGAYSHVWVESGSYDLVLFVERVDDGFFGEAATTVVIE